MADFLRGDVIVRIGNVDINDSQSVSEALTTYQGQLVEIGFIRGTELRTVQLKLNSAYY